MLEISKHPQLYTHPTGRALSASESQRNIPWIESKIYWKNIVTKNLEITSQLIQPGCEIPEE